MFSSGNSTNPFLQLSPSSHLSPPPFFNHDGHDIFHHHHPDLLVSDLFSANFPVIDTISTMEVSNKATTNQETSTGLNEHHCSPPQNVVVRRKRVGKNDRHSKIRTARGLRDRRVRLSIEIASKFFGLQDTLGFDKASKTLDWLLTNSKTAIKELKLTHIKHSSCNGGDNEASGDNGGSSGTVSKSKPLMSVTKEKKVQQKQHRAAFHLLARESRARARARARERTREKRRLNDPKEHPDTDSIPPTSLTQIEAGERMEDSPHNQMLGGTEIDTEDSVVIKRKLKPSSIFNDQQNLSNMYHIHSPLAVEWVRFTRKPNS